MKINFENFLKTIWPILQPLIAKWIIGTYSMQSYTTLTLFYCNKNNNKKISLEKFLSQIRLQLQFYGSYLWVSFPFIFTTEGLLYWTEEYGWNIVAVVNNTDKTTIKICQKKISFLFLFLWVFRLFLVKRRHTERERESVEENKMKWRNLKFKLKDSNSDGNNNNSYNDNTNNNKNP